MCREVSANVGRGPGWLDRILEADRVKASLHCDGCGRAYWRECRPDEVEDQIEALEFRALFDGWKLRKNLIACQGERDYCPECFAKLVPKPPTPPETVLVLRDVGGFTLIELLAVLAIIGIIAVATLPVVLEATGRNATGRAAGLLQGELAAARARAQRDGLAGIRLAPDPAFPVKRLADGSVDPDAPLAYSRVVPLELPDAIRDGRVSIRGSFPAGFPALGTRALVLEQEVAYDEGGVRVPNEPTAWAWRVRLGDRVELAGRTYAVCGPVYEANPEGFVNYAPPPPVGIGTGLDRGDGLAEWLLLVNGIDDDADGWIDNGWDGRDQNGDGVVDDPAEWTEVESWGLHAPVVGSPYLIRPRPVPAADGLGIELAGAVIDATGWAGSPPSRSRLPVDRVTGFVDLVVGADGSVTPVGHYAPTVPASGSLTRPFLHFWLSDRGSAADGTPAVGVLVTVASRSGRTLWGVADPADPEGSRREAEGGGL